MPVVWTDIRDLPSGEFLSVAQAAIDSVVAEAKREVSEAALGDRYDDAVRYLAAHLLAVLKGGSKGAAGPVTLETAGPVSRSYSAGGPIGDTSAPNATSYGRRFATIRRQVTGGPRVL